MPSNRFIVTVEQEADCFGHRRDEILDTLTGKRYYAGGGEPEDQTISRDWGWVVPLLNELAADARCDQRSPC